MCPGTLLKRSGIGFRSGFKKKLSQAEHFWASYDQISDPRRKNHHASTEMKKIPDSHKKMEFDMKVEEKS